MCIRDSCGPRRALARALPLQHATSCPSTSTFGTACAHASGKQKNHLGSIHASGGLENFLGEFREIFSTKSSVMPLPSPLPPET
eukprot:3673450-Alexandrium_andersonii.AAC.1